MTSEKIGLLRFKYIRQQSFWSLSKIRLINYFLKLHTSSSHIFPLRFKHALTLSITSHLKGIKNIILSNRTQRSDLLYWCNLFWSNISRSRLFNNFRIIKISWIVYTILLCWGRISHYHRRLFLEHSHLRFTFYFIPYFIIFRHY